MKRLILLIILLSILVQGCHSETSSDKIPAQDIRPPAVAGRFYPADPEKLRQSIVKYIGDAIHELSFSSPPIALIAPHAGYIFSGQIAADAFRQVMDFEYDVIVILGTNHTGMGNRDISIYPRGAYRTPLGLAEIDEDIAQQLLNASDQYGFEPATHRSEHSVEVHVPFVQHLFPDAKIVPVVVGTKDLKVCTTFGEELARILKGHKALIVASSDLSHYPGYDDAVEVDNDLLETIITLNLKDVKSTIRRQMHRGLRDLSTCACGEGPILTVMAAARASGIRRGILVSYANSGDALIGDLSRVVGYGAVVFAAGEVKTIKSKSPDKETSSSNIKTDTAIGPADRRALLNLARETINRYLTTETLPLVRNLSPPLQSKQGAFVTLKIHDVLRGCIGHMAEDMPLCRCVGAMAFQAAFSDRRFSPVSLDELDDIEIEISVLTPFKRIESADDIVIGRDGIIIRKGGRSAVYLPHVAVEQSWSLEETLDQLCRKAGLPLGSWRQDALLFTFQAEVFHEGDY